MTGQSSSRCSGRAFRRRGRGPTAPRCFRASPEVSSRPESSRRASSSHTADRTLIGETGFHGPPDGSGTVEVGYSIVPDYRGRRFASEAAPAPIERAFERPGIRRITAECLDYNVASLKGLERMGMQHVSSAGETLRFELRK